ncbi:MAG: DUF5067 domain-containing protein [Clostridiales bacterium]|nr:DUF5067 domain-containing protein [Clostridiales bacterium]
MRKFLSLFLSLFLVLSLSACGTDDSGQSSGSSSAGSEAEPATGTVAEYDDTVTELLDAEFDEGTIRVYVEYTNNGSEGMYQYESFSVKAFQNDAELADISDINDDESSANLIVEVKDGASIECSYVFELTDDADVEVRIYTPTADEELLATKTYTK